MAYRSSEGEMKVKMADLLLTAIKDASIEGLKLGISADVLAGIVIEMVDDLLGALKASKDLMDSASSRGYGTRGGDDYNPPPQPRRSPYNRS